MDKYLTLILITATSLCLTVAEIKIQIYPKNVVFEKSEGEGLTLTCDIQGWTNNDAPTIQWINPQGQTITEKASDKRVYLKNQGSTRLAITVKDVKKIDSGKWECVLKLPTKDKKSSIQLKTWKKIRFINPKTLVRPVKDGSPLIPCQVDSRPSASVSWQYNGKDIKNDRISTEKNGLRIRNIQESDNGKYTCGAIIMEKGYYKELEIEVIVTIAPKMVSPPSSYSKNVVGTKLLVNCEATGKPKPTYTWKKGDGANAQILSNAVGSRIVVNKEKGTLEINDLKKIDEDTYTCIASNAGGVSEGTYRLDVKVPPKITEFKESKGREGATVSMKCRATGNELPQLSLKKLGESGPFTEKATDQRISLKISKVGEARELVLEIKRLKATDNGVYTCMAINAYGSASKNATFSVLFAPKPDDTVADTYYSWLGAAEPAILKCVFLGNPPPAIEWTKGKTQLTSNRTYTIKSESDTLNYKTVSTLKVLLDFTNTAAFDSYSCKAKNYIGDASKAVHLKKAEVPGIPGVNMVDDTPTSVKLRISAPSDNGGLEIMRYKISYEQSGEPKEQHVTINRENVREDEPTPTTIAMIENLSPQTRYSFKVSAQNDLGYSDERILHHTTKKTSAPSKVVITSGKSGTNAERYTLTWDKPQTGGSPIVKYIIRYRRIELNETTWTITRFLTGYQEITGKSEVTSREIRDLLPNTTYQIVIEAVNAVGKSKEATINIRTSSGVSNEINEGLDINAFKIHDEAGIDEELTSVIPVVDSVILNVDNSPTYVLPGAKESKVAKAGGGLSVGIIIAVVAILVIVCLIVIDVVSYFRMGCGVTYTISQAVCARDPAARPVSDLEAGDKAEQPLLDETKKPVNDVEVEKKDQVPADENEVEKKPPMEEGPKIIEDVEEEKGKGDVKVSDANETQE